MSSRAVSRWHVPRSPTSTAATCRIAPRAVHIEDRGYQFADGVYEVIARRRRQAGRRRRRISTRLERSLRELRIAMPMARARARRWCCARWCAATACATASSTSRSRAAWRRATMPFPARRADPARDDREARAPARPRASAEDGVAVITHARHPLGALRHQVGGAAAQRARQAGGERGRRLRGLAGRRATAWSPRAPRPTPGS